MYEKSRDYSPSPETVTQSANAYQADPSPENLARLQDSVESLRRELFRRLNMAPGGTATLVAMRKALLNGLRAHPQWQVIDSDLLHLLKEWFNRGFLVLERGGQDQQRVQHRHGHRRAPKGCRKLAAAA